MSRQPRARRRPRHRRSLPKPTSRACGRAEELFANLEQAGLLDRHHSAVDRVGSWCLHERLGGGAFGFVHRASHIETGEPAAIKLLSPGLVGLPSARLRFEREARALASLHHPNISALREYGVDRDQPYLVLELVEGRSLRKHFADDALLGTRQRIDQLMLLVADLAGALSHAHSLGLVHRDVKPENVMLQPNGRAVLIDFGLAGFGHALMNATGLTLSGAQVGTPAYMSPEAVRGSTAPDPLSDVWALGMLLYEGVTGSCPFRASTREGLCRQVLHASIDFRAMKRAGAPRDLRRLARACLRRDPRLRIRSATILAIGLRDVVAARPIQISEPSPLLLLRAAIRAHPLATAAIGAITTLAIALSIVSWGLVTSNRDLQASFLAARSREEVGGQPMHALSLALEAHDLRADQETLSAVATALSATDAHLRLPVHRAPIVEVTACAAGNRILSIASDGTARLLDADRDFTSLEFVHDNNNPSSIHATLSPDGAMLATVSGESLRIWDAMSGVLREEVSIESRGLPQLRWSPDSAWLAIGGDNPGIVQTGTADVHYEELASGCRAATALHWQDARTVWCAGENPSGDSVLTRYRIADSGRFQSDGTRTIEFRIAGLATASADASQHLLLWGDADHALRWAKPFAGRPIPLELPRDDAPFGTVRAAGFCLPRTKADAPRAWIAVRQGIIRFFDGDGSYDRSDSRNRPDSRTPRSTL